MKLRFVLVISAVLGMAALASAAPPLPDTETGRRAAGYLEAFNSGQDEAMRAFLEANVAKSALAERPIADRITGLHGLRAEHGHLQPVRVLDAQEDELRVVARDD